MQRRNFVGTCGGAVLTGLAGCTGSAENPQSGSEETEDSSDQTPGEYVSEIGFELLDSTSAKMYALVTEDVSRINIINADGSQFRSITVPEGVSKANLGSVRTFRKNKLQFLVLDSDGNELDSFTRDFEPHLEFHNLSYSKGDNPYNEHTLQFTAEISNTGNSPIFVSFISAVEHPPTLLSSTYRSPTYRVLTKEDVQQELDLGSEMFQGILPDSTETVRVIMPPSAYIYTVVTNGGESTIEFTDIEWNKSQHCQGESRELKLSVIDTSITEYTTSYSIQYDGGAELIFSDGGDYNGRKQFVCNSMQVDG